MISRQRCNRPELVRRARAVGPRSSAEPLCGAWLERVRLGRERSMLLRSDATDDLADPIGGSLDDCERTAVELESPLDCVAELGFGRAVCAGLG